MPLKDPIKRKEYDKEYYYLNREKRIEKSKNWAKNNKSLSNAMSKKYYIKNKEKRIKKIIEYERKNLKTDINWVLKKRLRSRLRKALKKINTTKSKTTMKLLGVTNMDFFKMWIERKFSKGMTWKNINLWHIDHIIPCSYFDLTKPEEQAKCFHYTNLQPLWASENLSKGNRIS